MVTYQKLLVVVAGLIACNCLGMEIISNALPNKPFITLHSRNIDEDLQYYRSHKYLEDFATLDITALEKDLEKLILSSDPHWPSDYHNYAGLFVRMTWHCAGNFRKLDGEGGCDGGRQRFDPELSWEDNTNLDKAHRVLEPLKRKYGNKISWGDLIVMTGTKSIEVVGGPNIGYCLGRVDDLDGRGSEVIGPNNQQETVTPCPDETDIVEGGVKNYVKAKLGFGIHKSVNGNCSRPYGTSTKELIYVNPGGFMGHPDPSLSAEEIRDVFDRMGWNAQETIALVGGGHSFGKKHGACLGSVPPGDKPKDNREHPWAGKCGDGKLMNSTTNGFEGPWTDTPTQFSNKFFKMLVDFDWELGKSPAGQNEYHLKKHYGKELPTAPAADLSHHGANLTMLVTDIAFLKDPEYKEWVQTYANDEKRLFKDFGELWYKLMNRDMGPASRCIHPKGKKYVPEPRQFQAPLPERKFKNPNFGLEKVTKVLDERVFKSFGEDIAVETAYLCAATFRESDHHGGCNGARIRLEPEITWEDRRPLKQVLDRFVSLTASSELSSLSAADLIVLAASHALSKSGLALDFCPGRVDADSAPISDMLELWPYEDKAIEMMRHARLLDISLWEYTALQGRPRNSEYMKILGYSGSYYDPDEKLLTNRYAKTLLSEEWEPVDDSNEARWFGQEYKNKDGTKFITERDYVMLLQPEFRMALIEFEADENIFFTVFQKAWTKIMNNDRFDGPVENECSNGKIKPVKLSKEKTSLFERIRMTSL